LEAALSDGILTGKRVLICGARNKWSISWHVALSLMKLGATTAYSCFSERERDDVRKLLAGVDQPDCPIFLCDATKMDDVDRMFDEVGKSFDGKLDGVLHGMAFAKREELVGEFIKTSQDGFALALDATAYTLIALTRAARPLMNAAGGGSVVTLSYLGAACGISPSTSVRRTSA